MSIVFIRMFRVKAENKEYQTFLFFGIGHDFCMFYVIYNSIQFNSVFFCNLFHNIKINRTYNDNK